MKTLLQLLCLSDRYEQKARLLPGLIAASPVALTLIAAAPSFVHWVAAAGLSVVVEIVLGVTLAVLSRARGRKKEDQLREQWGGMPTTRFLRPNSSESSEQVRVRWRSAIKTLTGMTLPAAPPAGKTPAEVDQLIDDAIRQLRYAVREHKDARMVSVHNEEYGFARNLLGLTPHWIAGSVISLAAAIALQMLRDGAWIPVAVAGASLLLALLIGWEMAEYVRRCADRYAESLLSAAVAIAKASDSGSPPTAHHAV